MKLEPQPIEDIIWREKYRLTRPDGSSDEHNFEDTNRRVVRGVYEKDGGLESPQAQAAFKAMNDREWCPAGRIHAGAGTDRDVTLINCYVMPTIEDSMITEVNKNSLGIMDSLKVSALTQRMGGGIGMDFSTLRPKGAIVSKLGATASGPLSFMEMWNSMCTTIMSAGYRRGAMMATMRCDHPEIEDFIAAKHESGRLTNFNVSVLVTDSFIQAIKDDKGWDLKFDVPRHDGKHAYIFEEDGRTWYVYKTVRARELWDTITHSTYKYAEPGVIFIDRVNEQNNLRYCEIIQCSNPCGEQVLPPNGDCCLGAINLAVMVHDPFTREARVDFDRIGEVTQVGMRFLDNVIDVTRYPTEDQATEARAKRRTGLGITGLGNLLQQMCMRYGSNEAIRETTEIMKCIRDYAYQMSVDLAKERGPFPLFNKDAYVQSTFIKTLPSKLLYEIAKHGIRNGVLLTIAPTGTTSIYYGNVSSGIEPTFAWQYQRKVLQPDGSLKTFDVEDFGYRLYEAVHGKIGTLGVLPSYMVTTKDLTVSEHVQMQAVCQKYIDSSISKTINCPESMTFEEFQQVYLLAYEAGCKGCTTYRPCPETERVRGSVLSTGDTTPPEFILSQDQTLRLPPRVETKVFPTEAILPTLLERPAVLYGSTYKIKWPKSEHAFYITINDYVGEGSEATVPRPFEIFINTKDAKHQEWIAALTRSLSAIFRRGGDVSFVPQELKEIHSSLGGAWVDGKYALSLVALIGSILEDHFVGIGIIPDKKVDTPKVVKLGINNEVTPNTPCPKCMAPTLIHSEGCNTCLSCGYSDCG